MTKILLSVLFSLLLFTPSFPQVSLRSLECYSNHSIRFEIVRTSSKLAGNSTIIPAKYLYVLGKFCTADSISDDEAKFMVSNLHNRRYDWGFNIALYSRFRRDAFLIMNLNPRTWRARSKADDVVYWENYLKE